MYEFRLYTTGKSEKSQRIIDSIKQIVSNNFKAQYSLDTIDVLDNPSDAESDKIMVTPTLIKLSPPPVIRIIGDLGDSKKIKSIFSQSHKK